MSNFFGNQCQGPVFLNDNINFESNSERKKKRLNQIQKRRLNLNCLSEFDFGSLDINFNDNKCQSWLCDKIISEKKKRILNDGDVLPCHHKKLTELNDLDPNDKVQTNIEPEQTENAEVLISDLECSFDGVKTIDHNTISNCHKKIGGSKGFIQLSNNLVTKAICNNNDNKTSSYLLALNGRNDTNTTINLNSNYYVEEIIKEENENNNSPIKSERHVRKGKIACYDHIRYNKQKLEKVKKDHDENKNTIGRSRLKHHKIRKKFVDEFSQLTLSNCKINSMSLNQGYQSLFKDNDINALKRTLLKPKKSFNNSHIRLLVHLFDKDNSEIENKNNQPQYYHSRSLTSSLMKYRNQMIIKKVDHKKMCSTFRNYVSSINSSTSFGDVKIKRYDTLISNHMRNDTEASSSNFSNGIFINNNSSCTINLLGSLLKLKYSSYQHYKSALSYIEQHKYNLCLLIQPKYKNNKSSYIFQGLYRFNLQENQLRVIFSGTKDCPKIIPLSTVKEFYKFDTKDKQFLLLGNINNPCLNNLKIHAIAL